MGFRGAGPWISFPTVDGKTKSVGPTGRPSDPRLARCCSRTSSRGGRRGTERTEPTVDHDRRGLVMADDIARRSDPPATIVIAEGEMDYLL